MSAPYVPRLADEVLPRMIEAHPPCSWSGRHLTWLRDQLGDRFIAGAVLHTGPGQFALRAGLRVTHFRDLG